MFMMMRCLYSPYLSREDIEGEGRMRDAANVNTFGIETLETLLYQQGI